MCEILIRRPREISGEELTLLLHNPCFLAYSPNASILTFTAEGRPLRAGPNQRPGRRPKRQVHHQEEVHHNRKPLASLPSYETHLRKMREAGQSAKHYPRRRPDDTLVGARGRRRDKNEPPSYVAHVSIISSRAPRTVLWTLLSLVHSIRLGGFGTQGA